MALKATIYKFDVSITDLDRNYYNDHQLTVAKHPSETSERMMLRLLAFILNASETLEFTKGLSDTDEPDLWQKDMSDVIELWIALGQPSESRVKKGSNQSNKMAIYAYEDGFFNEYWAKQKNKISVKDNISVVTVPSTIGQQLVAALQRTMAIQVTIQDGTVYLTVAGESLSFSPTTHL
ncbi:YaeQ family protein [Psychrosphaera sp. B3R10]|uniref:YaeQ family protein n=1 Tax=unclassified Psychrosphaera TaxID=2641570 RepID=UPI001C08C6C9|nr:MULTISPECIES: YaeQ family protein [unclassified Psychrosphaera]MBU2882213.1 YaeQ family protein [Psychrosphaera sp. I2R16]MBU2988894.1 YaeQ family protein [Psychrosphaera sp. B3R10]